MGDTVPLGQIRMNSIRIRLFSQRGWAHSLYCPKSDHTLILNWEVNSSLQKHLSNWTSRTPAGSITQRIPSSGVLSSLEIGILRGKEMMKWLGSMAGLLERIKLYITRQATPAWQLGKNDCIYPLVSQCLLWRRIVNFVVKTRGTPGHIYIWKSQVTMQNM